MNYSDSEWAYSYFPLYTYSDVESFYGSVNLPLGHTDENRTLMIAAAGGLGSLRMNDQTIDLKQGDVLLLPAASHAAILSSKDSLLHIYLIRINCVKQPFLKSNEVMQRPSAVVLRPELMFFPYEPGVVAKAEELYMNRSPVYELRHIKNQMVFHDMLYRVIELQEIRFAGSDQPSIERSIDFLETHFSNKISREQLAAIAGLSRSHYSILFKQLTGFSTNEYLTRLRLHRAMELLLADSGTLREIALKAGYKDEFYLSRRFKQYVGFSPSSYVAKPADRIAVLLPPYTSHLLLLGIEPTVAVSESGEYANIENLTKPLSTVLMNMDSTAEQMKKALLETKTELIIAARPYSKEGIGFDQLRLAAPVIDVSWMEVGWKEHLRLIAKAVGRRELAERWLVDFEREEKAARQLVQSLSVAEEKITILVLKPDELLVYGARNAGYVLYHSLGLKPSARIQEEMEKHGDRFHSLPINPSDLPSFAGDRFFVILFADQKGSVAHAEAVFETAAWKELPAVRNNRVHKLDQNDWIPYNPVSIRLQLQRAVTLLAEKSR